MFKECKDQCQNLIVGVQTDPTIDRPDKNKPIQSLDERLGQVWSLKFVDKVIVYETEEQLLELLRAVKPDVRFVGADHEGKEFTGHDMGNIVFNSRKHNYSSSELRQRIIDRDKEAKDEN
jgi:glycerol-3-phosphate cytidylyltransferase